MISQRWYEGDGIKVQVRGLDQPESDVPVKLHIEHKTGAALIAPECTPERTETGFKLQTTGFDGVTFSIDCDDTALRIEASAPTPILGGEKSATVQRAPDPPPRPSGVRVTGDEVTMPIPVKAAKDN